MIISEFAHKAILRGVERGDCISEMEALGLSQRIINSLEHHLKITTLEQLVEHTEEQLLAVPNIGGTALEALHKCLERYTELDAQLNDES